VGRERKHLHVVAMTCLIGLSGCDAVSTKESIAADLYRRVEAKDCLAFYELQQRKDKGERAASTFLGLAIQRDLGQQCVDKDLLAVKAYELSAGKVPEVDFNIALILLKKKEYAAAEASLLRAAGGEKRNGLRRAMVKLGQIYEAGLAGFPNSASLAGQWYQVASDKGDLYAQTRLASMLIEGRGMKQNAERGVEMLDHAAQKGNRDARLALFKLADTGQLQAGRRQPEVAAKWLGAAAIVDASLAGKYQTYLNALRSDERDHAEYQVQKFRENVRDVWVDEPYDLPIAPKSLGEVNSK
jgi:TPR repeat protein